MTPEEQKAEADRITKALAALFDPSEVKFKPAVVSGNRAMALAYTDARVIQDRLDEVLGVAGWQDTYEVLPDGGVTCKLSCLIGGEWLCKMDVGSPSEQPDGGDRMKAAFSDALKRAAVKFGIGRYLYRLPAQWVDYDPQKRAFARPPKLPDWATESQPVVAENALLAKNRPILESAAKEGSGSLAKAWKLLSAEAQAACKALKDSLKVKAAEVDRNAPTP